jgi:hypothetical protein
VRVRGGHPKYIVEDDILDDDTLYSETKRKRATEYHFSVPSNMITPGGQIVVVGTPFHMKDVYASIEATGKYAVATFPAFDDRGRALFSMRYDVVALENKRQEIGPTRFAREFMCKPLTDEASYFPSKLFEGAEVRLPYVLGLDWKYWTEKGCERYTGVDIAMSAEVGADWFVVFTIAVDEQGVRHIANIRRKQGLGLQAQLDILRDENTLMRPAVFHIEANQAQRIIPDEAIRTTDLPIRRFFTTGVQPKLEWKRGMTSISMGKHNLDRGVPSLRMSLENKKWRIPRGDANSIELTDTWIGEMGCISFEDGQVLSVGEHDDTVMACLPPGQLVTTARGMVPIEDVGLTDRVRTQDECGR